MQHMTKIRVCGFHIDTFGHVNNARYLEFLETARCEFAEQRNLFSVLKENNWGLSVVNININYRSPAFFGDSLRIDTQLKSMGNKSITLTQTVFKQDQENAIADADVIFVVVDLATGKGLVLNDVIKQHLLP